MKPFVKTTVAILFLLVFAAQAHAAAPQWEIDSAHAGIYFGIDHIHSTTRGYFENFKGTVMLFAR